MSVSGAASEQQAAAAAAAAVALGEVASWRSWRRPRVRKKAGTGQCHTWRTQAGLALAPGGTGGPHPLPTSRLYMHCRRMKGCVVPDGPVRNPTATLSG